MNRVIDDNAERRPRHRRRRHADLTHQQGPKAERHQDGHGVGKYAEHPHADTAQRQRHDHGDQDYRHRVATQHAVDVSLGYVGEHDGGTCWTGMHRLRCVLAQPGFGFFQKGAHLHRGNIVQGCRHAGRRLVDVDPVVEIQAERQRHLVKQQVLGRKLPVLGDLVPGRIVAVHVLVQPLDDVGVAVDMADLGSGPQPDGKRLQVLQVFGIADATRFPGLHRELDRVKTCQVLDGEFGVAPERHPMVEILHPLVVQVDGRHHSGKRHGDDAEDGKHAPVAADNGVGDPLQDAFAPPAVAALFGNAKRQQTYHRR